MSRYSGWLGDDIGIWLLTPQISLVSVLSDALAQLRCPLVEFAAIGLIDSDLQFGTERVEFPLMLHEQFKRIGDNGFCIGVVAGFDQTLNLIFNPTRKCDCHDSSLSISGPDLRRVA